MKEVILGVKLLIIVSQSAAPLSQLVNRLLHLLALILLQAL